MKNYINYTKVLALSKDGSVKKAHCPLVLPKDREFLESTFNYFVRDEKIIELGISEEFKCKNKKKEYCKHCPFNTLKPFEPTAEEVTKSASEMMPEF